MNPFLKKISENQDKFDKAMITNLKDGEEKEVLRFTETIGEREFQVTISISYDNGFYLLLDSNFLFQPRYFSLLLNHNDEVDIQWAGLGHLDLNEPDLKERVKSSIAYNLASNYALEVLERAYSEKK